MEFNRTEIEGVLVFRGKRFFDHRGFFSELYKENLFLEKSVPKFVQDNLSESSRGVIRGLHWQEHPFGQGKLVTCLSGSILDVAVDVRHNSISFGKHVAVKLTADEPMSLWVPIGFAHGFQALEDNTRVFYKVTDYWNKEAERSLNPLDSELDISWPIEDYLISDKDLAAPKLNQLAF